MAGRGPWARFSSSLLFSRLGSGLGKLGSTVASSSSMATVLRRSRTVIFTVIRIRFDFICQCSMKCPQEFEIQIFEIFQFG
jgi:hypothetical protein